MANGRGRRVIIHELDEGLVKSYRFLDLKTRDFVEAAPVGVVNKRAAYAWARNNGLRIERSETEQG